jgi:hypothetical protein
LQNNRKIISELQNTYNANEHLMRELVAKMGTLRDKIDRLIDKINAQENDIAVLTHDLKILTDHVLGATI